MSKKKKISSGNSDVGAQISRDVNVGGNGTFIGRDQINGNSSKPKIELIIPIIVAIIGIVGAIAVAILNSSTEIDKIKLQSQMTQTAESLIMSPKLVASLTLSPTHSNPTSTPSP